MPQAIMATPSYQFFWTVKLHTLLIMSIFVFEIYNTNSSMTFLEKECIHLLQQEESTETAEGKWEAEREEEHG